MSLCLTGGRGLFHVLIRFIMIMAGWLAWVYECSVCMCVCVCICLSTVCLSGYHRYVFPISDVEKCVLVLY